MALIYVVMQVSRSGYYAWRKRGKSSRQREKFLSGLCHPERIWEIVASKKSRLTKVSIFTWPGQGGLGWRDGLCHNQGKLGDSIRPGGGGGLFPDNRCAGRYSGKVPIKVGYSPELRAVRSLSARQEKMWKNVALNLQHAVIIRVIKCQVGFLW